jgi:hypothetical protein
MKRTGIATLPLHGGRAPFWLFERMKKLASSIITATVLELGTKNLLRRLSDPYWFQCLGCVLGFDWHSSGLTTTVTGAIKEGIKGMETELGFFVAGGKGKRSRNTPEELRIYGERYGFDAEHYILFSRLSAKVDNTAIQDGYQLYHHCFFLDQDGNWAVIQQGMSETDHTARRYHWLGETVESFVVEPHSAVCADKKVEALNLVHHKSLPAQKVIVELVTEQPDKTLYELRKIAERDSLFNHLNLPMRHSQRISDIKIERFKSILLKTYERGVRDFQDLLSIEGVGPKTLRALSLISELIYGTPPSYEDPARYSYAVGGKDGVPYPVDRITYDKTIEIMERAINKARIGRTERLSALKRLNTFLNIKTTPLEKNLLKAGRVGSSAH